MSVYLAYTSPARGHLYPLVPTLLELRRRGHDVHVRTLSSEVRALNDAGLSTTPIAEEIESLPLTDWRAPSPFEGLVAVMQTFAERAKHEVPDLHSAVDEIDPDVLIVDTTTIGANTVAELGDRPWVQWLPFFYGPMPFSPPPCLAILDEIRAFAGAPPLGDHDRFWNRAGLVLYFTGEPLVPPEPPIPSNFRMVGPGNWDPPTRPPAWVDNLDRPIVLVTVSSEYQLDEAVVRVALEALGDEDLCVVVTTVAHDPSSFNVPANAIVERVVQHQPLIARAACVVCHGGMGITQKALSAGVPVCIVPGGRDQSEVAERVVQTNAGTRVLPDELDTDRLRVAVRVAMTMSDGAARVAAGFDAAGGAARAADEIESFVGSAVTIN